MPRITRAHISKFVPATFQNRHYNMYAPKRTDEPLYMLEEWHTYITGARASLEVVKNREKCGVESDDLRGVIELLPTAIATAMAVAAYDRSTFLGEKKFMELIAYDIERAMKAYEEAKVTKKDGEPVYDLRTEEGILAALRTDPSAKRMREFLTLQFGAEWSKRVLGVE